MRVAGGTRADRPVQTATLKERTVILIAIIACEIAFWVAILAGLTTRYLLRRPRVGAGLLIAAPLIDVVLLILVAADLVGGGVASWHHGLAAIYIGVSIAYGKSMVAWADVRFTHRFAGGPAPVRLDGRKYTAKCWVDVVRTAIAAGIAAAILGGLILLVDDPHRSEALQAFIPILGFVLGIDILWAVSYTVWPRKSLKNATDRT